MALLNRTFSELLDFTRATTATFVGSNGLIQTAAIDAPRFTHDPVTLDGQGLLIEEAKTNLLSYPRRFDNAGWSKTAVTITPNAGVAPNGSLTASKITPSATTGNHFISVSTSILAGRVYSASVHVKADGYNFARLQRSGNDWSTNSIAIVNLVSGEFSGSSGDFFVEKLPDGWFRISIVNTIGVDGSRGFLVGPTDSASGSVNTTGDEVSGILVWHAQLEEGTVPTSVIPDGTTFTSRASTATYLDSTGTLRTAAVDVARDDAYGYVDGVLKPIGLLLEGAGTNLVAHSGDFSQWSISRAAITDTFIQNGVALFELTSTADGASYLDQTVSGVPSGDLSVAIYTKSDFYFRAESINRTFNVDTKTQIFGSPVSSLVFLQLSDGLFRVSFTVPNYTIGGENFQIGLSNKELGAVGVFGSINIEEGSYPTSYIPTEGSQVTRAADVSASPQVTRAADSCVRVLGDEYNASQGTLKTIAAVPVGQTVVTLGNQSIVSDSENEKLYSLSYTSNLNATEIKILPNVVIGTIKSLEYFARGGE